MGLYEDLFDFNGNGKVDLDDDFMFMAMMDQIDKKGGRNGSGGSDGCYIATCVYGSYNCPEVWTLRRFRDYRLGQSLAGRLFIKLYYAVSPCIVSLFGDKPIFKHFWRKSLDPLVAWLNAMGLSNEPYQDRNWRKS